MKVHFREEVAMRVRGLLVLALLCLAPPPSRAEAPLVVLDTTDQVVGQIVGVGLWNQGQTEEFQPTMLYVLDSGDFALFKIERGGTPRPYSPIYFENADCSGQAYANPPGSATFPMNNSMYTYVHVVAIPDRDIYRVATTSTPAIASIEGRKNLTTGVCEAFSSSFEVIAAEFVEAWRADTPPYRIALNPLIFNDGFGTGDPSRWTNF